MRGIRRNVQNRGGDVPQWTPKNLAGLVLWLRSDMGITLNGGNVSAWADQSGIGDPNRNAVQAVAGAQPLYTSSDPNWSGKPSLLAQDGFRYLATGTWGTTYAQPTTIYTAGSIVGRIFDGVVAGNRQAILSQTGHWSYYAGVVVQESTTASSTRSVACVVFDNAGSALYLSDSQTAAKNGDAGGLPLSIMGIMGTADGAGLGAGTEVVEIIAYTGAHDSSTRQRVMSYLGSRYGKTVS